MARKVPLDAVSDWIGSACRRTEWTPGGRTERLTMRASWREACEKPGVPFCWPRPLKATAIKRLARVPEISAAWRISPRTRKRTRP